MQTKIILYKRFQCHLCEQAQLMLQELGVSFQAIDIDDFAELQALYNYSVPVLFRPDKDQELVYPFNKTSIIDFLK